MSAQYEDEIYEDSGEAGEADYPQDGLFPFFPLTISSSLLSSFSHCNMRGYLEYLLHLSKGRQYQSVHLIAGAAYAKGLEVARGSFFTEGQNADYAMMVGEEALVAEYGDFVPYEGDKHKKCLSGVVNLYRAYFEKFPLDNEYFPPVLLEDGQSAIEYQFKIELPFLHPDLGIPLYYVGRFDALVEFNGKFYGLDDKTKSGYPSQKQKEADSAYEYLVHTGRGKGAEDPAWATRSQFTGYAWAMQQLGLNLDGFIIREAYFQSGSSWHHRQVFTPRRQKQIDVWGEQMLRQVGNLIEAYKKVQKGAKPTDCFDLLNDSAGCVQYGTVCPFMEICTGELAEQYIESQFEQEIWIPEETRRASLSEYIDIITGAMA